MPPIWGRGIKPYLIDGPQSLWVQEPGHGLPTSVMEIMLLFLVADIDINPAAKGNNSLDLIEMFIFSALATAAGSLGYLFWTVFLFITDWALF